MGTHQKLLSICCGYSLEAPKRMLWVLIRRASTCPGYKTKHMFRVLIRSLSAYVVGIHLNPLSICCEYSSEAPQNMLWVLIRRPSTCSRYKKKHMLWVLVRNLSAYVIGTHLNSLIICCGYSSEALQHMLWIFIRSPSKYVVGTHQKTFNMFQVQKKNICCGYSSETFQHMLLVLI